MNIPVASGREARRLAALLDLVVEATDQLIARRYDETFMEWADIQLALVEEIHRLRQPRWRRVLMHLVQRRGWAWAICLLEAWPAESHHHARVPAAG